jgi:hypothetical protein
VSQGSRVFSRGCAVDAAAAQQLALGLARHLNLHAGAARARPSL